MSDRYAGKPFLRLVDSYVLDAIGALDTANRDWLTAMEPNLRHTYGRDGAWQDIVAAEMRFPDGMAGSIREVWDKGRVRFLQTSGEAPDPVAFTHQFVDTNFPH
ncbi:hypothetical protein [Croceicoccus naphthovorans]|uniref:Uncharacterized protein n=1 Tax=Croceicoccus naphthovorans TaxID=1348774 RepID=A0A0G3XDD2_9SPHN|nr:hypothetical protein [Croceicoccus naphthovorans]AKM09192.1 hypothetical protein AB433_03145 [Croceicoccus naphthovorans]MBB3990431.1 hypothetical protein [Croceicoccus naphthovorans]